MARAEYYVDPTDGDDGTGDGTSELTAWATVDHALGQITPGGDGDRINVKNNGDETSAQWTLTDYAASGSATAPLIIEGYGSSIGDGTLATVDCNGGKLDDGSAFEWLIFRSLKFKDWGAAELRDCDRFNMFENCEFDGESARDRCLELDYYSYVANCAFYNFASGNDVIDIDGSGIVIYACYIEGSFTRGIRSRGQGNFIVGNVVRRTGNTISGTGIECSSSAICANNTVYSNVACTGSGIESNRCSIVVNNYVEGYSGVGGQGFVMTSGQPAIVLINNHAYNNTTNFSTNSEELIDSGNTEAGSSMLDDPSNGDFTIETNGGDLKEDAYPTALKYLAQSRFWDVGAIQREEPTGGGNVLIPAGIGRFGVQES